MKTSKELTVEGVIRWIEKLEKLTSQGAKVVHVRHLLEQELSKAREEVIEEAIKKLSELSDYFAEVQVGGDVSEAEKDFATFLICKKVRFTLQSLKQNEKEAEV